MLLILLYIDKQLFELLFVLFIYLIQIQSIFTPPNVQIKDYKRGSITKLDLPLSPQINYVLGCNGVGKSSINMAILLACGSKNPELKDLIQEGKDNSVVIVWICSGKGQMQIRVIMRRRTTGITTDYYLNGQSITQNGLRKKLQSYNIYIDNPFMSMTQFDSQKILKLSGDKKLEFVQQLSNSQIKKLSYENMQKEFQDLDQCLKLFNTQRNEFQQAMAEFTKQNVLKELKLLKRELRKNYFSCCFCDTKDNIQAKQQTLDEIQQLYQTIIDELNKKKVKQAEVDDQIDQLKLKEQEQFKEMNQNTQQLEKYSTLISQQYYKLLTAKQHYAKLVQMKNMADDTNIVDIQKQKQQQQQIQQECDQQLLKLNQELEKLQEELQSGTNNKQIEDQQQKISKLQSYFYAVQNQKINQSVYGNQQLRDFYQQQIFQQNHNNIDVYNLRKFVIAGGDTMIKLSKESTIPYQTRISLLLFTSNNILRTIYTNDKEYSKRLEEINVKYSNICTVTFLKRYEEKTYQEFLDIFKVQLQNLKIIHQREKIYSGQYQQQLQQYNIQSFFNAFEGHEYMQYQIASRLQNYYYLDKIKIKENRVVDPKEGEDICVKFLQSNNNAIGIVFQDNLYRILNYNGERVGMERIKLYSAKQRVMQPQEKIVDVLEIKQQIYQELLILQQYQNEQKDIAKNQENSKILIQQCKDNIKKLQKQKFDSQDLIDQYNKQLNQVKVVTQAELQMSQIDIQKEQIKCAILIQRCVDINNRIIKQYQKDKYTLNDLAQLKLQQKDILEQIQNLTEQQQKTKEQKQEVEQNVNKLKYQLQQQIIELAEFYDSIKQDNKEIKQLDQSELNNLYTQCQDTLKKQKSLKLKIQKNLKVDNAEITAQSLQQYIQIVTQMLKQNASHQIHDLPQLQSEICKNINQILLIYAKISVFATNFIDNVKILNDQLENFVQELSNQFQENLKLFNVSGELRLNIWSENMYQKKFQDFLKFFTSENINQMLGSFYKIYLKYQDLCGNQNNDSDDDANYIDDNDDQKQFDIKPISTMMDEFDQQSPDEFQQAFTSFTTISQFSEFQSIVNNLRPSLQIISRFSSGAKQQNIILSGGEQSVTTLCIAACCKKVAFLLSDEINQNLDSKFEVAAHNLVCSLQGQAIISSPKIDVGENFDNERVNIIILSKLYGG